MRDLEGEAQAIADYHSARDDYEAARAGIAEMAAQFAGNADATKHLASTIGGAAFYAITAGFILGVLAIFHG